MSVLVGVALSNDPSHFDDDHDILGHDDDDVARSDHSDQESSGVFSAGAPSTSGEPSPCLPPADVPTGSQDPQTTQMAASSSSMVSTHRASLSAAPLPEVISNDAGSSGSGVGGSGGVVVSELDDAVGFCLQFVGTLVGEEGDVETPPPPSRQIIPLSVSESRKLTLGQLVFHTTNEGDPSPRYIFVYMVTEPILTPT